MATAVTVPGASGTTVTIAGGNGDALLLAQQIGHLLSGIQGTIPGASDLSVTTDTVSGSIPPAPVVVSDEPTGTGADVYRLYQAFFNREPDAGGLSAFTAAIDSGQLSLAQAADSMAKSAEFAQGEGQLSNLDFVRALYQNMFGRDPEGNSGPAWAAALAAGATRGSVAMAIAEGAEAKSGVHQTIEQKNDSELYRLYEAAFRRSPDEGGESSWSTLLANGGTMTQIATDFTQSAEFANTASEDPSTFINTMYQNALNRLPDTDGKAAWLAAMNAGMTQAQVLLAFADSAEAKATWNHFADDEGVPTYELSLNGGPGGLNTSVPAGYDYLVVNDAASDTLTASNAAIVAGTVGGTYFLSGNSTLAAAGGNNIVTATGDYVLSFGDGNNLIEVSGSGLVSTGINGASTVFAAGAANTIDSNGTGDVVNALFGNTSVNAAGTGNEVIGIAGNLNVTVTGISDTVVAGSAATTVDASTSTNVSVQGGTGPLDFVGGAGGATIIGGSGGSTVFGAANSNITFNGPNSLLYTAGGSATLNAAGSTGNVNASMAGGNDSIVAGGGAETLDGGAGLNQFLFDHNNTQGNAIVITDSSAQMTNDVFNFTNYGGIDPVVTSTAGQPVVLTLTDNTTITFSNVTDPLLIQTRNI
jgi:TorA maturation chaperone TorD